MGKALLKEVDRGAPTNIIQFIKREIKRTTIQVDLKLDSCFNYLKDQDSESVDLVLIDPPYEISKPTGFASGGGVERFAVSMDFGEWDKNFSGMDLVIKEAYRVLKKGGTLICFYDLWKISTLKGYLESAKFRQIRFLEWIKSNPVPLNSKRNYLTGAREIALLGVKGAKPVFNAEYHNGVYEFPIYHDKNRFHPTQKPVGLIEEIIRNHSHEGAVVLDCFSGSGTTALAAIRTNRNFRGCEIDSVYHQKSIARLEKERRDITINGV